MRLLKIGFVLVVAAVVSTGCASRRRGASRADRPSPCAPPITGVRFLNKTSRPVIVPQTTGITVSGYDFDTSTNTDTPFTENHPPAANVTISPARQTVNHGGLVAGAFSFGNPLSHTFEPTTNVMLTITPHTTGSSVVVYTTDIALALDINHAGAVQHLNPVVLRFVSGQQLNLDFNANVVAVITGRPGSAAGETIYSVDLFARFALRNGTGAEWAHASASTTLH